MDSICSSAYLLIIFFVKGHICFFEHRDIWAPASLLKLFLLPCSSFLASTFPCLTLADVEYELISDLAFLDKVFIDWDPRDTAIYRQKTVLKPPVTAKGLCCEDGGSSLEGDMRIIQVSQFFQCCGGKPNLRAVFWERNGNPSWTSISWQNNASYEVL